MDLINAQTAQADFLSLLSLQLQNQDPIDPVGQEDLINDLTQFSILEGIQGLNATFDEVLELQNLTQGIDLVGKEVEFFDPVTGEFSSGTAERLQRVGNQITISVGDRTIAISDVTSVSQPSN